MHLSVTESLREIELVPVGVTGATRDGRSTCVNFGLLSEPGRHASFPSAPCRSGSRNHCTLGHPIRSRFEQIATSGRFCKGISGCSAIRMSTFCRNSGRNHIQVGSVTAVDIPTAEPEANGDPTIHLFRNPPPNSRFGCLRFGHCSRDVDGQPRGVGLVSYSALFW